LVFFSKFFNFTGHGPNLGKVTGIGLDRSKWVRKWSECVGRAIPTIWGGFWGILMVQVGVRSQPKNLRLQFSGTKPQHFLHLINFSLFVIISSGKPTRNL